ncbi:hypothetical protein [Haloferax sp. YSMS24]|uniref:hypothetical protein n=1 Tax=Haloferax sp. YSMS24 TaxID=3388425 RepID=UPI00398CCC94
MTQNPITGQYLTTTPVIFPNGNHATGFYFWHEKTTYLVTNRHVLDLTTENNDKLDQIKIRIRDDPDDLDKFKEIDIPLFDDKDKNIWLGDDPRLDIGLIPLEPPITENSVEISPPREISESENYAYGSIAFRREHFPAS